MKFAEFYCEIYNKHKYIHVYIQSTCVCVQIKNLKIFLEG